MKYDFMSQTAKLLQEQKKSRQWLIVFLCLAVTVVLGTLAALKLYGQAMTHKVKVLECSYEVHEHTEECYKEEAGKEKELICVYADYVVHVHNDDCYNAGGSLVCPLDEVKVHEHEEKCYKEVKVLVCKEETAEDAQEQSTVSDSAVSSEPVKGDLTCTKEAHAHGDSCHSQKSICEVEEHTHGEDCVDEEDKLTCTVEEHSHGDDCYDRELTCEAEEHEHTDACYEWITPKKEDQKTETTKQHVHTDACYVTEKVLSCGKLELHMHEDKCYAKESFDKEGKLIEGSLPICKLLQLEEHVHGEDCFETVELTGEEVAALNAGATLHIHTKECYDGENNLICGHEVTHLHGLECYDESGKLICELAGSHVHSKTCYDEEGNLTCGQEEIIEHEHDANCYDIEGELVCGYEDAKDHEHDAACYDEEENLICGYEGVRDHEHDANCLDEEGSLICGYEGAVNHEHSAKCYNVYVELTCGYEGVENHSHTEACLDEEGNLICGYEVAETFDSIQVFKGGSYDVIVRYNKDADLPEDARLIAEEITAQSDPEHYEAREAEYREALEDEGASIKVLLKIGFYVEDENGALTEVEPKTPVMVSVQFLDEDGLLEGSPVSIVHFAEEGTKVLEGGDAVDNSTTFQADSFSEYGIGSRTGERVEDGKVVVSDAFEYEDSILHITFYVEGEAAVLGKVEEISGAAQEGKAVSSDTDPMMILRVRVLDEGEERYQVYSDYLESSDEQIDSLFLQVMSCHLFYGDKELDLSNCKVTAKVEPTRSLLESAQSVQEEAASTTNYFSVLALSHDGVVAQETSVGMFSEEEISEGLTVECFFEELGEAIEEGEAAEETDITGEEAEETEIEGSETEESETEEAEAPGVVFAAAVTAKVNPKFIVQFYANLNVPESSSGSSNTTIPFIDTSQATGLKGLPQNGNSNPPCISLGLNTDGTVVFNTKETRIYKEETKEFNPKLGDEMNVNYLNSLRDNEHYEVVELWVLKKIEGESEEARQARASGTNKEDWTIYNLRNGGAAALAFTNNMDLAGKKDENGRTYIVIEESMVMRLVYDPVVDTDTFKSTFYDYDISKGPKTATSMTTTHYGINSHFGSATNARYAFGNQNMGTDFGKDVWNGNKINMTNSGTYQGLSFGLVNGMTSDGNDVTFSSGITGPSIGVFGGTSGTGKIIYSNWNLKFIRQGDTFTLSSVSMSNDSTVASGLEKFGHPGKYNGTNGNKMIWTNNFWPLDPKWKDQPNILDPMFGGNTMPKRSGNAAVPPSDDGIDHNSYFGMTYSIGFDLVEEYVGPLEYYFYGDDDMWVFLDGKLVCDIGGVHSSVGEYVDLWDYISGGRENHQKGQHTLSVFYTERGASGSSCWMQFTLPQISQIYNKPYDPADASLTIKKVAVQFPENMAETAFPFVLKLSGIYNEYTVKHYGFVSETNDNGEEIKSEVVLKEEKISTNDYSFTLKNGEFLQVIGLPIGTTYWVEEKYVEDGSWETTVDTSVVNDGGTSRQEPEKTVLAHGTIGGKVEDGKDKVDDVTVTYTNAYLYSLPETGGSGTIIYTMAGAMAVLSGAGFLYKRKFRERRV